MADTKISALAELSARPAANDVVAIVDVSDTAMAASGSTRKIQFSNLGSDLLSTLLQSEVSVTGATTATISRMHVCSGTTADYTVTLPAVSGNAGKLLGFRMANALTKLVTLDGNGSEQIDGATTRVMWANETAILLCDGTGWIKIAGKTIPMRCQLQGSGGQSIPHNVATKITLDLSSYDIGALGNTSTYRITLKRAGTWQLFILHQMDSMPSSTYSDAEIWVNNAFWNYAYQFLATGPQSIALNLSMTYNAAAGDYIEMYITQIAGSARNTSTADYARPHLAAIEIPQW